MGQKIVIGPINQGQHTDRTAFAIDNDSFPQLVNAYQWRGRVKRKRGTSQLNRLKRYFNSTSISYNPTSITLTLDAQGVGNILTGFGLQAGNIVPGSVTITGGAVYTDPSMNGTLSPSGTIFYASGQVVIAAEPNAVVTVEFNYYPCLPVMGIEELTLDINDYPGNLGFDTKYSYNILPNSPNNIYDVSFYKNPAINGTTLPGYTPKTNETPTTWNGQNYQQFFTVNYQGALWATNGVTVPFDPTSVGMQYKDITVVTVTAPTTATLTIPAHGLVTGDFIFVNEVSTTTGINFQTGYVVDPPIDANNVNVKFPNAVLATNGTGGIAQYLTNRSDTTKDCLRFYDGDPTNGNTTTPQLNGTKGWVNFCPPLSQLNYSIAQLPLGIYYLVGARMIVPFKDRLLFIGVVVQRAGQTPIFLQDTIVYSQNGTPYYTASFQYKPLATDSDPTRPDITFNPILVPNNQTATAPAWFEDQTGFGGWASSGVDQAINSVSTNEDVLILGFRSQQSRLIYSGNDLFPFAFYTINSEYGTGNPFSAVNLDTGVISQGSRGFIITGQTEVKRIDLDIPDSVFEINLINNGVERVCSQRDFINEWIYFSYPSNQYTSVFPTRTLQYNYRDNSWAVFNESYTTYGSFKQRTGLTWATVGLSYPTWSVWNVPWNSGSSTSLQPKVLAGTSQGFIMVRDQGTGEGNSIEIQNISFPATITNITIGVGPSFNPIITANNSFVVGQRVTFSGIVGMTQLNTGTYTIKTATPTQFTLTTNGAAFTPYISGGTARPFRIYSPNHCLNEGDYIIISGALGTVGTQVNGKIFNITNVSNNEFNIFPVLPSTYFGGGSIKRMYIPFIQTKQFPLAWSLSKKTRLGPQQYLFTRTQNGQVTVLIYLSQDSDTGYNLDPVLPNPNSENDGLINSTTVYTCPESCNLGLTPYQTNLQMISLISSDGTVAGTTAYSPQQQIWHRMNTSLIGDTVQLGITLSDKQMRDTTLSSQFAEIELHSIILDVTPSSMLS